VEHVKAPFDPSEFEALSRLAERNIRPVPNEVRHIVREKLLADGLLKPQDDRRPEPVR
jgi:hypothetical protein